MLRRQKIGRRVLVTLLACSLSASLSLGCSPKKNVWQAGIPGIGTDFTVSSVESYPKVLLASLDGPDVVLDTYLPANDVCRRVVVQGGSVQYKSSPPAGKFRSGEEWCKAVGIGSLRVWRDRINRGLSGADKLVPRAQASYKLLYRDRDLAFLQGRFPLASRLGWVAGSDTIAVVANDSTCDKSIGSGVSSMEWRVKGPRPLVLISGKGPCEIQGLILSEAWRD
jgi:hypothetical protein